MTEKKTMAKARKDKREGKAASTQAGEFVHEEIEHVREGKHGARSAKQAIAIGLSKARRAGVKVPAKKSAGKKSAAKKSAGKSTAKKSTAKKSAAKKSTGRSSAKKTSSTRSRAATRALKREGRGAASKKALSRQGRSAAAGKDTLLLSVTLRLTAELIDRLPASIRNVATYSVGFEHIDLAACRRKGLAVFNTPDVLTDAVAEVAMLLLLGAARRAREASTARALDKKASPRRARSSRRTWASTRRRRRRRAARSRRLRSSSL